MNSLQSWHNFLSIFMLFCLINARQFDELNAPYNGFEEFSFGNSISRSSIIFFFRIDELNLSHEQFEEFSSINLILHSFCSFMLHSNYYM